MIGTLVNGRYRLDAMLGSGGMGIVYRAYDAVLDRPVAVKVLNQASMSASSRDRLLREARSAAHLNHPNIVSIYDAGEAEGVPFIVMELIQGDTLFSRPPETLEEILSVARQVCSALDHAHSQNIIHRDLKPENLVIDAAGQVKIMDFGLARSSAASRASQEGAASDGEGDVAGSVLYLAPELASGRPVDGKADLYALGVMLYEWTTGQLPFSGADPLAVIAQHLHAPVTPPGSLRAGLPPTLEAVILRLLSKDPAGRFATAGELSRALSSLGDHRSPAAPASAATPPNNLPVQLSSFVGREREIQEVIGRLAASRLVTLTGPGGSGKTRLALQVAGQLLPDFPNGVWLVELAPISDPDLLPQTALSALGVPEQPGRPLLDTLSDFLRSRRLLLILDNCEHLVQACAHLAEVLLRSCPNLKILATSREGLGITGESPWAVPPLSAPDLQRLAAAPGEDMLAELAGYEAVQLFVERAAAVQPSFTLTAQNAAAVAQICTRLDGIPLAIELAAARMRALSVEGIAARLDDRFSLLTLGSRTALPRQQTLRATIDWSYDLLPEAERTLLNRLSVFAGDWRLEAAEEVCGEDEGRQTIDDRRRTVDDGSLSSIVHRPSSVVLRRSEVLDLLTHLVDKSLVLVEEQEGEARYHMLETIRQYTREKLLESGELPAVHDRHLAYYLRMADEACSHLRDAQQVVWLERLEAEHDNLRSALDWAENLAGPETGLRLAGHLALFWYLRGYWTEGRERLGHWLNDERGKSQDVTAAQGKALAEARLRAVLGAGWLADERGQEKALYEEGRELSHALGDRWSEALSLRGLGVWTSNQNDDPQAIELLHQSLELFRQTGDAWGTALVLFNLGWITVYQDDLEQGRSYWEQSSELFRQVGDRWGMAVILDAQGYLARLRDDYRLASELSKEALALFRELGDKAGIATSLLRLGSIAFRRDEYPQAISLFEQSMALSQEMGYRWDATNSLRFLALIAAYQGDFQLANAQMDEVIRRVREIEYPFAVSLALATQGLVLFYQGDSRAEGMLEESVAIQREQAEKSELAERSTLAFALTGLGRAAHTRGDLERAQALLEEAIGLYGEISEKPNQAAALAALGRVRIDQGQREGAFQQLEGAFQHLEGAAGMLERAFIMSRDLGSRRGMAEALEGLGALFATQGEPERAARLFGAAAAIREAIAAPLPPVERPFLERWIQAARGQLGEAAFDAAVERGRKLGSNPGEIEFDG